MYKEANALYKNTANFSIQMKNLRPSSEGGKYWESTESTKTLTRKIPKDKIPPAHIGTTLATVTTDKPFRLKITTSGKLPF